MTSSAARPGGRDRRFREIFRERAINVREVGPAPAAPLTLSLRRFPFPYRAGLAISNDTSTMSLAVFNEVHAAFAKRGLELGVTLSFGDEVCAVGTPLARDMNVSGLADSLAGLSPGGATEAVQRLAEGSFRPKCFIGDLKDEAVATLCAGGVRYFTDPSLVVGEKFGDGLELRSTARLQEAFGRFDYDELGPGEATGTDLDGIWDKLLDSERRRFAVDLFNSVLFALPSPESSERLVFKRYRGAQRPAATTLPLQLRSMFLDSLEAGQGAAVIEQRLGETALLGQASADEDRRRIERNALSLHEEIALDELSERAVEKVLVTTPARLLDWVRLRSNLRFAVDETNDVWLIRLTGIDGTSGSFSREEIEGLSFVLPEHAPETLVIFEGHDQALPMRRAPEPLMEGHHCLYLPWEKRVWAPC